MMVINQTGGGCVTVAVWGAVSLAGTDMTSKQSGSMMQFADRSPVPLSREGFINKAQLKAGEGLDSQL